MADYIVDGAHLESIANAIREKTNTTDGIRLADMGAKIKSINISNSTPTPETSAGTGGIIDVVKLPVEDISESNFYRLMTVTIVHDQRDMTEYGFTCCCVDGLPETGLPATNANMDILNIYYNVQDGVASGYIDEMLSAGLSIPSGWYEISTLLAVVDTTYGGIITNIDDDPCDDAVRLLLKYDFYIYKHEWMKLPFACEKDAGFDIQWDGVIGDRISLDTDGGFTYVKVSDKVPTVDEVSGANVELSNVNSNQIDKCVVGTAPIWINDNFSGAFSVGEYGSEDYTPIIFVVYDADAFASSLGIPTGIYTNGVYFAVIESGEYVSRLSKSLIKITKIDSKFIDADLSGYATTSEVNSKINQAIGNAIGGSY